MRLRDLNPKLDTEDLADGVAYLEFDCPHCRAPGYINVKIAQAPSPDATHVWTWNGATDPDALTLSPSINCAGHWHGFVKDGEIT